MQAFFDTYKLSLITTTIIYRAKEGTNYPPDATIEARKFVIRDFVVGSSIAVFGNVTADGTKVDVSQQFIFHHNLGLGAIGIYHYFQQQYFSNIREVSLIGGRNQSTRRIPPTCCRSLINFSQKVLSGAPEHVCIKPPLVVKGTD